MGAQQFDDQPRRYGLRARLECRSTRATERRVRTFAASRGLRLSPAVDELIRLGLDAAEGRQGVRRSQAQAITEELVALRTLVEALGPMVFAGFELAKVQTSRSSGAGTSAEYIEAESVSHARARWEVVLEAAATAVVRQREAAAAAGMDEEDVA